MNSKIFCQKREYHPKDFHDQSTVEPYLRFLKDLCNVLKAKAVSGFSKNPDFMEPTWFDIAYLHCLFTQPQKGRVFKVINKNSKDFPMILDLTPSIRITQNSK